MKIYIIFWVSALGSVSEVSRSLLFRPFCNRFGNQEALCRSRDLAERTSSGG